MEKKVRAGVYPGFRVPHPHGKEPLKLAKATWGTYSSLWHSAQHKGA